MPWNRYYVCWSPIIPLLPFLSPHYPPPPQVRTVRNDVAALLQTIYLAEISIQSLQDYEKGSVLGSSPLPSILPILDVADVDSMEDAKDGNHSQGGGAEEAEAELAGNGSAYDVLPPAKRRYTVVAWPAILGFPGQTRLPPPPVLQPNS